MDKVFVFYIPSKEKFVYVNAYFFKYRAVSDIHKAGYWRSKKSAKNWLAGIKKKFPDVELREAKINLVLIETK